LSQGSLTPTPKPMIVSRRDDHCQQCGKAVAHEDHIFCGFCGKRLRVNKIIEGNIPGHDQQVLLPIMEELIPLIAEARGRIPKGALSLDHDFVADIGFDWISEGSMDVEAIGFLMLVAELLGIDEIPEDQAQHLCTVRDLCDYIATMREHAATSV